MSPIFSSQIKISNQFEVQKGSLRVWKQSHFSFWVCSRWSVKVRAAQTAVALTFGRYSADTNISRLSDMLISCFAHSNSRGGGHILPPTLLESLYYSCLILIRHLWCERYRIAVHCRPPQKQLRSSSHNSIISHIQEHEPGASLISSSSPVDGGSAADVRSSQLWTAKVSFAREMKWQFNLVPAPVVIYSHVQPTWIWLCVEKFDIMQLFQLMQGRLCRWTVWCQK